MRRNLNPRERAMEQALNYEDGMYRRPSVPTSRILVPPETAVRKCIPEWYEEPMAEAGLVISFLRRFRAWLGI